MHVQPEQNTTAQNLSLIAADLGARCTCDGWMAQTTLARREALEPFQHLRLLSRDARGRVTGKRHAPHATSQVRNLNARSYVCM